MLVFFCGLLVLGCAEKAEDTALPIVMEESNNVLIVMDDELWLGALGDSVRSYLAVEVPGVRPPEPMFSLNHLTPSMFKGGVKKFRNVILFNNQSSASHFKYLPEQYAKDQVYFDLESDSNEVLMEYFLKHAIEIRNKIYYAEISLIQKQIKSRKQHSPQLLLDRFDMQLDVPSIFEVKVQEDDFIWFKKERASGSIGLLVYAVDKSQVMEEGEVVIERVYAVRDSISGKYIHSTEEGAYVEMIDYFEDLKVNRHINGVEIMESFGSWDMKNSFMGGTTLTYIFEDTVGGR